MLIKNTKNQHYSWAVKSRIISRKWPFFSYTPLLVFINTSENDQVDIDRYFPNNKIVKILNAGHVIHLDNPRDTITTIDEYLNSSKWES